MCLQVQAAEDYGYLLVMEFFCLFPVTRLTENTQRQYYLTKQRGKVPNNYHNWMRKKKPNTSDDQIMLR